MAKEMQDNIEFFFGQASVEDVDFSTLVLEWATLRWYHHAPGPLKKQVYSQQQ